MGKRNLFFVEIKRRNHSKEMVKVIKVNGKVIKEGNSD
jgi:hypothetical protein